MYGSDMFKACILIPLYLAMLFKTGDLGVLHDQQLRTIIFV